MSQFRYSPELVEKMRRLYEQDGWTLQQIADEIGKTQKAVNKVAKRNGFVMRRTGPKSGPGHPGWKGGSHIDKHGYILIYRPDHPEANHKGQVREHRLVAEQILGRPLLPTEVVHHRNDDPGDNRPENLVVYATNGQHLAETLKGKCPRWTPEGLRRIADCVKKPRGPRKRRPSPDGSGVDVPLSPQRTVRLKGSPDTADPTP